jgi:phosphate transport system permease protein
MDRARPLRSTQDHETGQRHTDGPATRKRKLGEGIIEAVLLLAALSSVGITLGIVGVLLYESSVFFQQVSVIDFLTDTQWTPLFADAHWWHSPATCRYLDDHGGRSCIGVTIGNDHGGVPQ